MKKKVAFRFDIDTLKCIKYGVPKLVNISKENEVKFTFFMNFGRSINRKEAFKIKSKSFDNTSNKMSTIKKLGVINYFFTVIKNPELDRYEDQIKFLINSDNEIGLHGGLNHGTWQLYAESFGLSQIQKEIDFGLKKGKKYEITFSGFTSPGMTSNKYLSEVLMNRNFNYISDTYTSMNEKNKEYRTKNFNNIKNLNVDLTGDNGIGYFEYYLSKNLDPKKIMEKLLKEIIDFNQNTLIIYDHPLIIQFIEENFITLIKELKNNNVDFVTLSELA